MASHFDSLDEGRVIVRELVEKYRRNRDRYRSSGYNEETTRNEFINPFFEALGWDIQNRSGAAEQYKDCVHEHQGRRLHEGTDYTFRFGGDRKFFVEAKKPSVELKGDAAPAYQLRRYAWTAKLPLSILTDFEELAVYDTRIRPNERDKASVARVLFVTFDQVPPRYPELQSGVLLPPRRVSAQTGGIPLKYSATCLSDTPIPAINFGAKTERARHDRVVRLVDDMLHLHERLTKVRTTHEQQTLMRQVSALDAQIDATGFELYALTDEEIRLIEASG